MTILTICEQLKQFRAQRHLSQEALASLLNVSFYTIYRWEQGKHKPSRMAQDKLRSVGIAVEN